MTRGRLGRPSRQHRRGAGAAGAAPRPRLPTSPPPSFTASTPARGRILAAPDFPLPLDLLAGVDRQKGEVLALLRRFAAGVSTNHALLWGARGAGKSSLVKAAVMAVAAEAPALRLLEVSAPDLDALPDLFTRLEDAPARVVLLCDDLSFEEGAAGAKALKSTLEGGVAGPPDNVLVVATSNRRHLMPRSHEDGDRLASAENAEESLSMSDRFGVWLGFPPMDQPTYLAAVRAYAERFGLPVHDLDRKALQWAQRRGARSGRVAVQFIRDLAGEAGRPRPL